MANLENIAMYDAYPICFLFLGSTYHTCSATVPLCCFTSSPGQLDMADGSGHLSTSQHPNRTSAERQGTNYCIYASLPQIKLYFLNVITSSGSWSDVFWSQWKNCHCFQWLLNTYSLQYFPGVCCCPLFKEFVLCCSSHQHEEKCSAVTDPPSTSWFTFPNVYFPFWIREHSPAILFTSQKC